MGIYFFHTYISNMQPIWKLPWWDSLFIINQKSNALLKFDDVIVNAICIRLQYGCLLRQLCKYYIKISFHTLC